MSLANCDGERSVRLAPGKDLLANLASRSPAQTVVAFAAETEDLEARGRRKMEAKGADLVVVNDVGRPDTGFDAPDNEVIIISRNGEPERVSRRSKREVAERVWNAVVRRRNAGTPAGAPPVGAERSGA